MKIENMTFDSSFLVSFLIEDDSNHKISAEFMRKVLASKKTFLMPMIVLFEVFHTLQRLDFFTDPLNQQRFDSFFNFKAFQYFDLNMKFFNLFRELPFFKKLKASDAIIASGALLSAATLISWDNRLVENSLNAYTPKEFLEKF